MADLNHTTKKALAERVKELEAQLSRALQESNRLAEELHELAKKCNTLDKNWAETRKQRDQYEEDLREFKRRYHAEMQHASVLANDLSAAKKMLQEAGNETALMRRAFIAQGIAQGQMSELAREADDKLPF